MTTLPHSRRAVLGGILATPWLSGLAIAPSLARAPVVTLHMDRLAWDDSGCGWPYRPPLGHGTQFAPGDLDHHPWL